MLPDTIVMRAEAHILKGIDPHEAIKLAFEEENNMLYLAAYGVDMETGRLRTDVKDAIQKELCTRVYNRIRNNH